MHWGREGKVSPRWAKSVRWILNRKILPHLADRDASELGVRDISKWHAALSETAPGVANRALAVLSKAYTLHMKWESDGIVRNPCAGVEKNPERKMERYLEPAEYGRFWDVMESATDVDRYARAAIMLIAHTGCRQGEVRALRWDEYNHGAGRLELEHHKTAKYTGVKRLPLSEPAKAVLAEVANWHDDDGLDQFAHVFPKPTGRWGSLKGNYEDKPHRDLGKFWRELRARMGLEDVRMHDLRHSFASMAAQQGMSLQMIGSLLGHSNITTTQRYAHLRDTEREQAADAIGNAIAKTKNT
jgi:integrase